MIIFHEGLPGAGKSYEAVVFQIIPALQKGRKVFAYIEGLNHARIAECAGISLEKCKELLIPLQREHVPHIYQHVENDSLVVIDELQNFWPAGKQKLSDEITRFVTEHRHRGLDILAMGQDLRDCHALWKRRVSQKVVFTKLDALGSAKRYRWQVQKAVTGEKFQKVAQGVRKYDPAYFGTYASHTQDTENTEDFQDTRANVFNTATFRVVIPIAFVLAGYAVYYLWGFFHEPSFAASNNQQPATYVETVPIQQTATPPRSQKRSGHDEESQKPEPTGDYLFDLSENYRIRLAGLVYSKKRGIFGHVEVLDDEYRIMDAFDLNEIRSMGWDIDRRVHGLELTKVIKGKRITLLARSWPIDPFGRVAQKKSEDDMLTSDGVKSQALYRQEKALEIYREIADMRTRG